MVILPMYIRMYIYQRNATVCSEGVSVVTALLSLLLCSVTIQRPHIGWTLGCLECSNMKLKSVKMMVSVCVCVCV